MIGWSVRSASGDCRVDGISGDRVTAWSEVGVVSGDMAGREDVVLVLEVGDERARIYPGRGSLGVEVVILELVLGATGQAD